MAGDVNAASGAGLTSPRLRRQMVERLRARGIRDERVLAAMASVPRHVFVDEALASRAYQDTALPLGFQQTISQPYVVARMLELLSHGRRLQKVLEIGAGSGYQAALLAHLAVEVFAVERIEPILAQARENLRSLRLHNLRLKNADGHLGLPEAAPFDGIIAAAATPHVPEAWLEQLAPGGRLVMPKGDAEQFLVVIEHTPAGFVEERHEAVRFVPLLCGVGAR